MRSSCYRGPVDRSLSRDPARPAWPLHVHWLGRVDYRDSWALQRALAAARADDRIPDQLLLLEHPPVLTLGRHADESHVLATPELLASRGIEIHRVERGGEVTYHGPGQLVGYSIVRLADHDLLLRPFVRALESALVETCESFDVAAERRDGHPGCWVDAAGPAPRKIGALGVRVERGVSYHGIALNVDLDLGRFELIDACGMPGVVSTSIAREAGWIAAAPSAERLGAAAAAFGRALARALGAELVGRLPPEAEPAEERSAVDAILGEPDAVSAAPRPPVAAFDQPSPSAVFDPT